MSTTTYSSSSDASIASAKPGLIASVLHFIAGEFRFRQAERSLSEMSDRELEDIGINRSQIGYCVRNSARAS